MPCFRSVGGPKVNIPHPSLWGATEMNWLIVQYSGLVFKQSWMQIPTQPLIWLCYLHQVTSPLWNSVSFSKMGPISMLLHWFVLQIKWDSDFVNHSAASKGSYYFCFYYWQGQSQAKLWCPAWRHPTSLLIKLGGVKLTSPVLLSPFKHHPMSLGTEGGQVSHWPWPKGLRANVSSEVRASKGKNEFELNKTGDKEVQTT